MFISFGPIKKKKMLLHSFGRIKKTIVASLIWADFHIFHEVEIIIQVKR